MELLDCARHDVVEELKNQPTARELGILALIVADADVEIRVHLMRVDFVLEG